MTDRRCFVAGVTALLASPVTAWSQPHGKIARIGALSQERTDKSKLQIVAFAEGLREHGHVEGKTLTVEWRFAEGDVTRFPDLIADLMRGHVDVIVASVNHAIEAARTASQTIPIVMVVPSDPVRLGFVRSLARPGGNITGLTWQTRELVPKRLQLLKEAVPGLAKVAVLWDPTEPARRLQVEEAQRAGVAIGVQMLAFEARSPQELEAAFVAMARAGATAALVEASGMFNARRARLAELAVKHRLATIGWWRGLAEDGCLLSYSPSITAQYRRAAYFVVKILDGAKPADLPIEQPTKYELVVNLRTAKALGLTIPASLLVRADQVIE